MKKLLLVMGLIAVLAAAGYYIYAASGGAAPDEADSGAEAVQQASETATENENEDEDGETAVPVNIVDVSVETVSTYLTATANLIPENEVQVLAEAEGRVTELLVEEGDYVKRGQLLAMLLRDEAEIAHNKAQVKATNARLAYERAERMSSESLIAQEEFDRIQMDHRVAQQELAETRWKLEKTEIRAPFDGRLTLRKVTLGQHIRPGDELFAVTDFDPLISRIYLPEKDVLTLEEDREVRITLKADENVKFRGRIRQISPVVDTATGTVKVTVEAIRPPRMVRPGGFVIIDITRETHAGALVLPKKAVIRELQEAHVFVARDGTAERRSVRLGLEEDDRLEILDGLAAGEQVVVAGQGGLEDGSKIKILRDEPQDQATQTSRRDKRPAIG